MDSMIPPEGAENAPLAIRNSTEAVQPNNIVCWLALLIAALAIVAAASGLWWKGGDGVYTVVATTGREVEMYGTGLYRHDTAFTAGGQRGADAIMLMIAVPVLLLLTIRYRQGSLRGTLMLTSVLGYVLYVYASAALGTIAYNDLFLVYVALLSTSLFALVLTVRSIDPQCATRQVSPRVPSRWTARFMAFAGIITLGVWLLGPMTALFTGDPPDRLDTYSTLVTSALDIAIIVPLTFIAAALIRKREFTGYLIAFPLLGIIVLLGPTFVGQSIGQLMAGVDLTPEEIMGPIAGFGIVAALATWVMVVLLRHVGDLPNAT